MAAANTMVGAARRVLIYRLGSLGDTVVALPALRLIARAFPDAERRLLTNFPVSTVAAPMQQVLGDTGLVDGYMAYPVGLRDLRRLEALRREIAAWAPDLLVYLTEPRGRFKLWRDIAFFHACGIRRIVGAPLTGDLARRRVDPETGFCEREASRLARCLAALGDARLDDPASWDLALSDAERRRAREALAGWDGAARYMALSIGTKKAERWPDENWRQVLATAGGAAPGLGLVLVGAAEESAASLALAQSWPGPVRDLCGRTNPRESGAVLGGALAFLGYDSGPMHLAAAVGTPVVALFARNNPPGVWFPPGARHRIFFPGLAWSGGEPTVTRRVGTERDIEDLPADQVAEALAGLVGIQAPRAAANGGA